MITSYKEAVTLRVKTPEDVELEMEDPMRANFAIYDYKFPNGIRCGVGKSKRPGHASLFQLIVTDFDGKPNVKFPSEFAGEYTSTDRAEKGLAMYCKEAWNEAERKKTKATRKLEAEKEMEKDEVMDVIENEDGEVMFDPNIVVSDEEALIAAESCATS